jgi:diadenosine tetraphosphate (Ap4A) HIT family hydrolase
MPNATARKFGYPATLIAEEGPWLVLLRPKQPTLGALVLVCREPATAFSELSAAAFAALKPAVAGIERTLQRFIAYERINYLMLMMVDPDVHYHVLPRYPGERHFEALTVPDAGWPGPPRLDVAVDVDAALQARLVAALKDAWSAAP